MNGTSLLIQSLISLLFLIVMLFWLYRDYKVDSFRQKVFALRDKLFDEAAKGKIAFSHPAYGMLRGTMNGVSRFGHRLNLPLAFSLSVIFVERHKTEIKPFQDRLNEATKTLSPEQAKMIHAYHREMNILMLSHMILSSPLLLITVILPVCVVVQAKDHLDQMLSFTRRPLDRIGAVALATAEA